MLRRTLLLAATALVPAVAAAPRGASAQARLRPDPTPRVPPQPGQGLPAEDAHFLRRASRLSAAQIEAGRIAAEKATNPEVRQLGAGIAEEHTRLRQQLDALAQRHGIDLRAGPGATGPEDTALAALRQANGEEVDRRFLARELALYQPLAEMYQTAASNSPEPDIQRLGIAALAALRSHYETEGRLAGRYGLRAEPVENPPQY